MLQPKCSLLVIRRIKSTLSSMVVRLPGEQEMQGSIPYERDYPLVLFYCHFIQKEKKHYYE